MKKTIYILVAAIALLFAACDKNKDEVRVYEHTAAQDIAGAYVGQWHCTSTSGTDTIYSGDILFTVWKDTIADVCFIAPRCPATFGNDKKGLTNVAHAGDDLIFNNDKGAANGIGTSFYGRVDANKHATMSMTIQGKEGRKTVMMTYTFSGQKQE